MSQVSYTARKGFKLGTKVAGEAYPGGQQKKRIKFFFKKTEVVGIKMRKKNPVKNIVHIQSSMVKLILCCKHKDAKRITSWLILVELFLVHRLYLFENGLIYSFKGYI